MATAIAAAPARLAAAALTPRVDGSIPRAGGLVWTAAAAVAVVAAAAAVLAGSVAAWWIAVAVAAFVLALALRLEVGVGVLVVARPTLDVLADRTFANVAGIALNPASLLALVVLGVGGAYLVERWHTLREAPAIAPFLVFGAVALASVAVAPAAAAALTEWLRFASILVTYGLVYVAARAPGGVRRLAIAVLLSAAAPVVVGVWQWSHGGAREIDDIGRATGTFLHPDPFGIYLGLVIPFAIAIALTRAIAWRWLVVAAAPAAAGALVGSYTRTGWAMVAAGVLLLGLVRHRRLLALAPFALVAIVLAVPSTVQRFEDVHDAEHIGTRPANSLESRVDLWRENLPKATRNPVAGTGLHAIVEESEDAALVHSDYVRALVETGVFGFAAYLWLLVAAVTGCWRGARRAVDPAYAGIALGALAAAVCFLLASSDSNLMTQVAVSGTAWTIVALGHAAAAGGRALSVPRRAARGWRGTPRRPSSAAS